MWPGHSGHHLLRAGCPCHVFRKSPCRGCLAAPHWAKSFFPVRVYLQHRSIPCLENVALREEYICRRATTLHLQVGYPFRGWVCATWANEFACFLWRAWRRLSPRVGRKLAARRDNPWLPGSASAPQGGGLPELRRSAKSMWVRRPVRNVIPRKRPFRRPRRWPKPARSRQTPRPCKRTRG